jgi:MFS family permease
MMTPAALSILTTTFSGDSDRVKALGVWSGTIPLASALGVLLGGLLSQGPGWRWVFFVNVPVTAAVVIGALRILSNDRPLAGVTNFDSVGAILSTGGMLLLVYTLVNAPTVGWGTARTIGELAGAAVLLGSFVVNEHKRRDPLVPFSIFRIPGLAAADGTQIIAQAGFLSMFFFVTLYMQNVLHLSPLAAGAAYLPVTAAVGVSSGIATKLLLKTGTRPLIVAGTLIGAAGVAWLSRIPVQGSYTGDVLPGLVVMAFGLGFVFVGIQNAANANVPQEKAGLAAALITASTTLGGALGIAIFSAIATSHTADLLRQHASHAAALTGGFQHALVASAVFLAASALIASRTSGRPTVDIHPTIEVGEALPEAA